MNPVQSTVFGIPVAFLSDQAFHYIVIPIAIWFVTTAGKRINIQAKKYAQDAAADALNGQLLTSTIGPYINELFEHRTPMLKKMMDESNDVLLAKINGTYIRSSEQKIRESDLQRRLDRMETKLDRIGEKQI